MNPKLLELHFSELVKVWHKSRNNNFSDIAKQDYNERLQRIFDFLKDEEFSKLNNHELLLRSIIIDFFFKSLEFLDNSTLSLIPYELIECLKYALDEWIDDSEDFIIVTSLINQIDQFSFDQSLISNLNFYTALDLTYKIPFPKKLIQINLPKYLARDYLANVILYHELGHFVDIKYRVSDAIKDEIKKKLIPVTSLSTSEEISFGKYFPYLLNPKLDIDYRLDIFKNHVAEYFSDIFASQYIEKASNYYLDYITNSSSTFEESHPSTVCRISLVEAFIHNVDEPFVNILKVATKSISNRELKARYNRISQDDFLNLLPFEIKSASQLSSLFILGWDLWLNDIQEFKTRNNMQFDLKASDAYQIINNLIEKSISNYVVETSWETAKKNVSV